MCRKCTKREAGEKSGNSPRAVNQAGQKRVKNGGPPETLRTSRHHRLRPEVGEDWGATSRRAAEEQSPKKPVESGAAKNTGVQQGGTKSDPATQLTGKVWLVGKLEGVEKDDQGHQKRRAEIRSWWKNRVPENGDLGVKIAGQKKSWRSGRRAPEIGYLGVKIAGQKKTRQSGRRVPESGYLGVKIAGRTRRGGAGEGHRKPDTWASK